MSYLNQRAGRSTWTVRRFFSEISSDPNHFFVSPEGKNLLDRYVITLAHLSLRGSGQVTVDHVSLTVTIQRSMRFKKRRSSDVQFVQVGGNGATP